MPIANAKTNTAISNPLCERLQVKFSDRGAAAANTARGGAASISRTAAKNTSKVRRAADPFEKTAEYTFASAPVKNRGADTIKFKRPVAADETMKIKAQAQRRCAASEVTTPFASGAYAAAYRRAADIRARAYDGSEAAASAKRQAARRAAARTPKLFSREWFKSFANDVKNPVADEVKVETPSVSKGIIIAILLCAMVVMMIIFSFAQISEFKREISGLEAKKSELCDQIQQLELDIDLKNDVRVIEQTATEDIGMVKSNQVQSKYITVGDGERIVVIDNKPASDAGDYGVFSTLMSAVSSNWDGLLDYIR